jgi:hypothetical protein
MRYSRITLTKASMAFGGPVEADLHQVQEKTSRYWSSRPSISIYVSDQVGVRHQIEVCKADALLVVNNSIQGHRVTSHSWSSATINLGASGWLFAADVYV